MITADKLREFRQAGSPRLDHHEHLRVRGDLPLPFVHRAHPGDDVHTGGQLPAEPGVPAANVKY